MVRGEGLGAEVVDEAVFLRILMDVGDQVEEVGLVCDEGAFEGFFKKGASPFVGFVEGFSVCIEETREGKMGFSPIKTCQVLKTWQVWLFANSNQEVKVVFQQAISKGLRNRSDVFLVEFEEVVVVAFFMKQVFPVVAAVEYVVVLAWE